MSAKKSDTPDGAISGKIPSPFKLNKRLLVKAALVVVVLFGLILGGRMYLQNRQKAMDAEFVALTKTVNSLTSQKRYDEAINELNDYIDDAPNQNFKSQAQMQLGSTFINKADFSGALSAFQSMKITNENELTVRIGVAVAAERLGDKPTAIAAYQRVIELLEPRRDEGYFAEDIKYYESKIKLLEAS